MNQFFITVISETLGELKTRKFFQQKAEGADLEKALEILDTLPTGENPIKGDEI